MWVWLGQPPGYSQPSILQDLFGVLGRRYRFTPPPPHTHSIAELSRCLLSLGSPVGCLHRPLQSGCLLHCVQLCWPGSPVALRVHLCRTSTLQTSLSPLGSCQKKNVTRVLPLPPVPSLVGCVPVQPQKMKGTSVLCVLVPAWHAPEVVSHHKQRIQGRPGFRSLSQG